MLRKQTADILNLATRIHNVKDYKNIGCFKFSSGGSGISIRSIKALAPRQRNETLGSRGQQGNPGGVPAAEERSTRISAGSRGQGFRGSKRQ
jgi:hypothetical protein